MQLFPILDELFHSDTVFLFFIGLIVALFIGLMKIRKHTLHYSILFIAIYLLCEVLLHIHMSFLAGFLILFAGTFALGTAVGFFLTLCIRKIKT